MKTSIKLTGEGLTRALRRLAHRAAEAGDEARRKVQAKEKTRAEDRERADDRRRT